MDTEERILSKKFLVCEVRTSRQPQPGQRGLDFRTIPAFPNCDSNLGEDESSALVPMGIFYFGRMRGPTERTGTPKNSMPVYRYVGAKTRKMRSPPIQSERHASGLVLTFGITVTYFCQAAGASRLAAILARRA
jgi:hypothetical protein